jgi:hypothetical protein
MGLQVIYRFKGYTALIFLELYDRCGDAQVYSHEAQRKAYHE